MDLNLDYSDDESPLSLKSDFILRLCELIVGGKDGLQPVQKTIIDRCVRLFYQTYRNDPRPENMPILEDLYKMFIRDRFSSSTERSRMAFMLRVGWAYTAGTGSYTHLEDSGGCARRKWKMQGTGKLSFCRVLWAPALCFRGLFQGRAGACFT